IYVHVVSFVYSRNLASTSFFFLLTILLPPRSTLFPYTTLFRSVRKHDIQKVSHTAGRLCQPAIPEFSAGNLYFQVKPVNQTILFAAFCFDTACFHRTGRLSEVNTRRFLKPLSLV